MKNMSKGLFITFEGGDGSGKSTQIEILKNKMIKLGFEVIVTREPGGTPISEKIREILLDKDNSEMCDMAETLLYAASRAQLVDEVIKPAIAADKIVICDRFVDSSIAYQAYGRNLGNAVEVINDYAIAGCIPDLTVLLKLDPDKGKKRINTREQDRIELASRDFHKKVYEGYLELEKKYPGRIVGINAEDSIDNIAKVIDERIKMLLDTE